MSTTELMAVIERHRATIRDLVRCGYEAAARVELARLRESVLQHDLDGAGEEEKPAPFSSSTAAHTWYWREFDGGETRDLCPRCAREMGLGRVREEGFVRYFLRDFEYVLASGGIRCTRCGREEVEPCNP